MIVLWWASLARYKPLSRSGVRIRLAGLVEMFVVVATLYAMFHSGWAIMKTGDFYIIDLPFAQYILLPHPYDWFLSDIVWILALVSFGMAVVLSSLCVWMCRRERQRAGGPAPDAPWLGTAERWGLMSAALVLPIFLAVTFVGVQERLKIHRVVRSPDGKYELVAYREKCILPEWGVDWSIYVHPASAPFGSRGLKLFDANDISRLEIEWKKQDEVVIRCDCSAGMIDRFAEHWNGMRMMLVEVPSEGETSLPQRPANVPAAAERVASKWVWCQPPRDGEQWNFCEVYADKSGTLVKSGRYRLHDQKRAATGQELRPKGFLGPDIWVQGGTLVRIGD